MYTITNTDELVDELTNNYENSLIELQYTKYIKLYEDIDNIIISTVYSNRSNRVYTIIPELDVIPEIDKEELSYTITSNIAEKFNMKLEDNWVLRQSFNTWYIFGDDNKTRSKRNILEGESGECIICANECSSTDIILCCGNNANICKECIYSWKDKTCNICNKEFRANELNIKDIIRIDNNIRKEKRKTENFYLFQSHIIQELHNNFNNNEIIDDPGFVNNANSYIERLCGHIKEDKYTTLSDIDFDIRNYIKDFFNINNKDELLNDIFKNAIDLMIPHILSVVMYNIDQYYKNMAENNQIVHDDETIILINNKKSVLASHIENIIKTFLYTGIYREITIILDDPEAVYAYFYHNGPRDIFNDIKKYYLMEMQM